MKILLRWLIGAAALWLTTEIYGGIWFSRPGLVPILFAALLLGLVNTIVRPIMIVLTLPLTLLTFGLFLLVVNALSIGIVAALTSLEVSGFWGALIGALIVTVITTVLNSIFIRDRLKLAVGR